MILSAIGGSGGGGATGGSGGYAPGMATTWGASTMGQKLSALAVRTSRWRVERSWRWMASGAGVGFAAGIVRLFVKGAREKARARIKAMYGVDIRDNGVLGQIVEMAKQAFGGNLDMAIRSQQVRDIIELYAMTTGQKTTGLPGTVQPVSVVQLPTLDRIGGGVASGGGPVVIQLDGPATTALLRGEAVQAIVENPRAVQRAAMTAQRSNSGRRQMASLQLNPGLLIV